MPLDSGSQLGPYRILNPLGAGGMGEVYRAHDPRLGRDIALKVLPAEMASDPARLERFTREARAIAALNHPHIVTIYSTEDTDGIRFLTMELVEGQPLDALIPPAGLPVARFLELALPLADALTAAHAKQITHRDLKPANVMVTTDGRVKVLDFGLARVGGPLPMHQTIEATRAVLTSEGTIVGTMPYMSPEQIEGRTLDHRTDLFSLGVMFHEMLTGSRPFTGESSPQLMSSILRDTPTSASDARTDVPDALSRLIHRCLEKRPDDRVQTARDIYNELKQAQKQLESGTTRRSPSGRAAAVESLWVAVLPFSLRGADADGDTLATGLTEDITAGLARFSGLSVVALQSARSFKESPLDVRQIAERLHARYILSGSVRAAASGFRVAAHLIDAHSGAQLWTETYDRTRADSDVFAVQDDLTDRIVATVADKSGVLARSMAQATRGIALDQLSAIQLVHRSWGFQIRPAPDEHAELRAALEAFVRSHPDEPAIWSALAQLYVVEHSLGFNPLPDSLGRAFRAARRSVEIDPSHQRGWAELAFICLFLRDETGARDAIERTLALNPRDANAVAYVGNVLTHMGEYDRGCELTERAMALNPSHAGWLWFAPFNRFFARRQFEQALHAARRVNIPDLHWMHIGIAAAAGHLGLSADGRTALESVRALAPTLLDEARLREWFERWYWDEAFVMDLLEGMRRSALGTTDQTPAPAGSLASPAATSGFAHVQRLSDPASGSQVTVAGTWIAVVPFSTTGSDEESRALVDGLTEDVTAGLSRFHYLSVVAAHTARQRAGAGSNARQLGAALGARYLLDGSIRRAGNVLRIGVRLVDSDSGAQLWSDSYARDLAGTDLPTLQDDLTDRIVATVADAHGVLMRRMSQEIAALNLEEDDPRALRFRYWAYYRQAGSREHALLRDLFERAVERQPGVAPFWAALANLYWHEHGFDFNVRPEALARARQAATRALDLDPFIQHAWEALATIYFFEHNREGFTHAVERVLALNPRNANAMALMGILHVHAADFDHGCGLAERAMELNPGHPGWYHLATVNRAYALGDDEGALRAAKRINMPSNLWAHFHVAVAAAQLRRTTEATAALDSLLALAPTFAEEHTVLDQSRRWNWRPQDIERQLDGYRKAMALRRATPAAAAASSATPAGRAPTTVVAASPDAPVPTTQTTGLPITVAVLPFSAAAADTEAVALAQALTDDVTTGFSRFSYLRVLSLDADTAAAGEPRAAGTRLGARYVVDGSVRTSGTTIRVSARLIEVESGAHAWAEQYDRAASDDRFALQDDVASHIVATLADGNGVLVRALITAFRKNPDQLSSLGLYLRFTTYLQKFNPDEHAALREAFEALVEREPESATTWADLALLYSHEAGLGFNERPNAHDRARRAAERAVAIDPSSQIAWVALAVADALARDASGFHAAAERAIQLNPLHTATLSVVGWLYAFSGDTTRGASLIQRAIALNPHDSDWYHMGLFLHAYEHEQGDNALKHAKRIELSHFVVWDTALTVATAGRFNRPAEARAGIELLARSHPHLLDPERVRAEWGRCLWEGELLDRLVDGFTKALTLAGRAPQPSTMVHRPPSSDARASASPAAASALSGDRAPDAGSLAIAVRLFTARGGDNATDLAEGLAEDVTTGLSRFSYLRVVPRSSVEGTATVPARYVLEGQVRRAASTVRVSARLIDTVSGAQLWAENYDRPADADVFQLQDDIASRIVATVADANGVMLRSMVATLRQRPIEDHTVGDLVLRFHGFLEHFDPAEHRVIRDRLMAALEREPGHADGWACLSSLIEHEYSHGLNPLPDSLQRARETAERSIAANPVCQEGWRAMASAAFFTRDAAGVRIAAERAIAINPLNTGTVAICGMFLAYSGAWDRGLEVLRHAMQPNPHYPGWVHFPFFSYHYNRDEYAEALRHCKPINMPRFPKWHLCMAAVAGRLGLRDEARAALEGLRRIDPGADSDEFVRAAFASWVWTDEEMEHTLEGVRQARALVTGRT